MPADARKINWRILFAEGAAIVVSILFAFAIDAWWKDRLEGERLHNGLVNLQAELRANIEMIDRYQSPETQPQGTEWMERYLLDLLMRLDDLVTYCR